MSVPYLPRVGVTGARGLNVWVEADEKEGSVERHGAGEVEEVSVG